MKKVILILILAFSFLLTGASCVRVKVGGFDGGVFKSTDKGLSWEQKVALMSVGQPKTIAGVNTTVLLFDPQDSNTLYLGTKEDGLFVSYDGAQSWLEIEKLPKGQINAIAVDPRAKHIVYVGMGGKIFKSTDCCRNWQNIYLEAAPGVEISSLAVDSADNTKVLAGLSDGRLLCSTNSGISWVKIYEFGAKIKQILINSKDTKIIYVLTAGNGLWRSSDGGVSWQSLDKGLQNYPGARDADRMIFDPTKPDSLLISSSYGLLRTNDGGQTWIDYKLLIQPHRVRITSFAINPKNPQEIYYTTATTFYRSLDEGKNWQTKSLPSKRMPVIMLVDPNNPNTIYLGVLKMEK
jgi:photosystem II stability/assembly factor-like uncharacterized protein